MSARTHTCGCVIDTDYGNVVAVHNDCSVHSQAKGATNYRPATREARVALIENLRALPQATAVPRDLITSEEEFDLHEADFLDLVSLWAIEYAQVVGAIRTTAADMARELTDLRNQRKAVRDFLGIPQLGEL